MVELPGFSAARKWPVIVAGFVLVNALLVAVSTAPLRAPVLLPWTRFDEAIPLLPWSIFIYLGYFPFVFGALCGLRERDNMNRVAVSMLLATAMTVPIFLLLPTAAPAVRMPELGGLTGFALATTTRANYSFHNVFPSMHAGYALLPALGYRGESRRWYPFALLGAFLISASTLLAKQHYVVDVPAGWLVAWACRSFVDRFVRFRFGDA